jgi:hypothetical protein
MNGSDQIVDHSTFLWGTDEVCDILDGSTNNKTLQYSICGEGIRNATPSHDDGAHSRGFYVCGNRTTCPDHISIFRNLIINNDGRTPIIYGGNPGDLINNVSYNGGDYIIFNGWVAPSQYNVAGNYFKWGPNMNRNRAFRIINANNNGNQGELWWHGNCDSVHRPTDTEPQLSNVDQGSHTYTIYTNAAQRFSSHPDYSTETDCLTALEQVPAQAGASVPRRLPDIELRLQTQVELNQGRIVNGGDIPGLTPAIPVVTRSSSFDTDLDGMPDAWEADAGLDPRDPSDGAAFHSNGYTNLENYLNQLAGDTVPGLSGDAAETTAPSPPSDVSISTG